MKRISIPLLAVMVMLSTTSCSYREYNAIATGSSLGAILGSSIGGLMGGPRGADKGTLAGMAIGAAAGAAVVNQNRAERSAERAADDAYDYRSSGDVEYGSYNSPSYHEPVSAHSDLEYLEVTNVKFLDSNNNQCLDPEESAFIVMDIYNRADRAVYNVTPIVRCSDKRVLLSPATTVTQISSGRGIRYKVQVKAPRRLRFDVLTFSVSFSSGKARVNARDFSIRAAR